MYISDSNLENYTPPSILRAELSSDAPVVLIDRRLIVVSMSRIVFRSQGDLPTFLEEAASAALAESPPLCLPGANSSPVARPRLLICWNFGQVAYRGIRALFANTWFHSSWVSKEWLSEKPNDEGWACVSLLEGVNTSWYIEGLRNVAT